jgi:hypothetical protein
MAKFRKVHTSFWDDNFIETLSPEDKYFYLFILTNPLSTECGIYQISRKKMGFYTGYNLESVDNILKRLIATGKIKYDDKTSEILIVNRVKYIPSKVGKPMLQCLESELATVKTSQFIIESIDLIECESVRKLFTDAATDRGSVAGEEQEEEQEKEQEEPLSIKSTNVDFIGNPPNPVFLENKEKFKKAVFDAGRTTYTEQMLLNFFEYWAEPNGARGRKMKWEKERDKDGWDLDRRMKTWAQNNFDKIPCYLLGNQKTIAEKKQALIDALEAYKAKYDGKLLNSFFQYWATPENIPDPKLLRWEKEEFWEIGLKLADWKTKQDSRNRRFDTTYPQRERFD